MKKIEIFIYDSLTKEKRLFVPLVNGEVSMYVCGPTVYDYVHVGNTRPVVVFDTLRRFFDFVGYKVTFVSNYTDVDDQIIARAAEEKISEAELSAFYIKAFEETLHSLDALVPTYTPKATEYIPAMQHFISTLIENEAAYVRDGEVFFRVHSVANYGLLANISLENLQVGARVNENEKKEAGQDFLLWKKTEEGIKWDSPWGAGRPGWHTECVAMINEIFKKPLIDIHGGGFDLKFPHHTNEIAQSEAYAKTKLANYWMHNGFINLNNEKMAKSTGNFVTAKDFINEYGAPSLRLLLLSTHYRAPVNLSADIIANSQNEVVKIERTMLALKRFLAVYAYKASEETLLEPFLHALADDLNTPNALSVVYALIKEANIYLRNTKGNELKIAALFAALSQMLDILGLALSGKNFDEEDVRLLKEYENARLNKDYQKSDELRNMLQNRGVL